MVFYIHTHAMASFAHRLQPLKVAASEHYLLQLNYFFLQCDFEEADFTRDVELPSEQQVRE